MSKAPRVFSFLLLALLVAIASQLIVRAENTDTTASRADATVAALNDAEGHQVGFAAVTAAEDGDVAIHLIASGLTPGEHGIHIHAAGSCDPAGETAFSAAGGHFNPSGAMHGKHAGDLGNLVADKEGDVWFTMTTDHVTLTGEENALMDADGSALVIHADVDDLVTDPSGNSGGRIICAVLAAAQ
jgi:Cu-Zn family superoxide dismutase